MASCGILAFHTKAWLLGFWGNSSGAFTHFILDRDSGLSIHSYLICNPNTPIFSQNHRMAWVGRDLMNHESPTPLPQAGPPTSTCNTRPGCPGPHPPWPWTPPGMGTYRPILPSSLQRLADIPQSSKSVLWLTNVRSHGVSKRHLHFKTRSPAAKHTLSGQNEPHRLLNLQ